MNDIRRYFLMALAIGCLFGASVASQAEAASLPEKVLVARTAYLIAVSAKQQPLDMTFLNEAAAKPIAQTQLDVAIRKWSRFEVVGDVTKADVVLLVVEWEDRHRWGNAVVCRDQLFVFDGGRLPGEKARPVWTGDPEKWGKFGGCSGAGEPVKELRKLVDKGTNASR